MTLQLVTVDEAKEHLQIDLDVFDAWLAASIAAISQSIVTWCGSESIVKDVDDNVFPLVKTAALIELAYLFTYRDGEGTDSVWASKGYPLKPATTQLLTQFHKPLLA